VAPAFFTRECSVFDLGTKDPDVTPPVRARWAWARECLPSSREPTSRNPWASWTPTF